MGVANRNMWPVFPSLNVCSSFFKGLFAPLSTFSPSSSVPNLVSSSFKVSSERVCTCDYIHELLHLYDPLRTHSRASLDRRNIEGDVLPRDALVIDFELSCSSVRSFWPVPPEVCLLPFLRFSPVLPSKYFFPGRSHVLRTGFQHQR